MPDAAHATPDTPSFAAALSSLFTLGLSIMLRDVSGIPGPGLPAAVLIVVASGVCRAVAGRFAGDRSGTIARTRAFALTLLVSYTVISLARPIPFADRFVPDLLTGWRLFLVVGSWALTAHFFTPVLERRSILGAIYAEREEEKRRQVMRDISEMTAEAMRRLRTTRRLAGLLFVLLVALALAGWASGSPPSPLAFLLVALYAIVRYLTATDLDTLLDEYGYIGDGNRLPGRYRRRRMRHAAVLILAAGILASPLASRTSILPPELLGQAVGFLSSLMPTMEADYDRPELPDTAPEQGLSDSLPENMDIHGGDSGSSQWIVWVLSILQRLAITTVAAGLVVFLFAPLWTKEMRRYLREKRWKDAAIAWLSALQHRIARFLKAIALSAGTLSRLGTHKGLRGRRTRDFKSDMESRTTAFRSRDTATRRVRERASKRFQRLERWAGKNQQIFRRSHEAPAEFAARIAEARPDIAEALQLFASRYEQALFSAAAMSKEAWNEMESALRTIVRSRPDNPL